MGKKLGFIFLAATLVIGALGLSVPASADTTVDASPAPTDTAATDESLVPAAMPTTVAGAFPDGLPEGAVQIDATTVSFDGGLEILYLAGMPFSDCVSGQLCFWANADFGGQSVVITQCCYWIDLSAYGFNNQMSSWRNHRPYDAMWAYGTVGSGNTRCMAGPDSMSYVGDADNDKATSVRLKSVSGTC